ncbi:hypothetical protein M3Y97_00305500 [Aphelenchoides bicaudatus]|nr:hypothetical protein M3Y97_00305500 [Aphelenchoides bicaudatus]
MFKIIRLFLLLTFCFDQTATKIIASGEVNRLPTQTMVHVAATEESYQKTADEKRPATDPILNGFIYLLSSMAVIGGFLFGYDTGIVSAAMLYVVTNEGMIPIDHMWQEWIVAVTPGFAAIGSLVAGKLSDRFGRRYLIIVSSIVFTAGSIVCGAAPGKWVLLCGRVLLGIAIGIASMVVPVFISECAPLHVRGKMLTYFNIMVCFGQLSSNVVAGGFSYIDGNNVNWRLMLGFAAIPSIIQLIGFMFLPESPRWLFTQVGEDESEVVLKRIYNNNKQWVEYELDEIVACHEQEIINARKTEGNFLICAFYDILLGQWTLKALLVGCSLQIFQQFSAINTIMYYTGTLIKSAGIRNNHTIIWLSVITSFVNFIGNFIPFALIERYGRRRVLLTSVAAVTISLVLLGTSFLLINKDTKLTTSPEEMQHLVGLPLELNKNVSNFDHCIKKQNCDFCVTDDRCGFCSPDTQKVGLCLPLDPLKSDQRSSTGYCSSSSSGSYLHSFNGGQVFEWADVYCKTKYTAAPLALMVLYLLVFSAGYAPLPWVLNAEFYPLWARSTCVSISTFMNWATNLLISVTFLTLSVAITRYGTFYMYAALTAVAFIVFYKFIPETTNTSLDEVESLFMTNREYEQYHADLKLQMKQQEQRHTGKPEEPPKLCGFVYLLTFMSTLGGFSCGYNTGNISSAMLHVTNNEQIRPVSHLWQESIVGVMPIFAAIGALFAGKLSDIYGRKKMILLSACIFTIGSLICAAAIHKMMLLCGRIFLGVALGIASTITPIYLAECSPSHIRGKILSAFNILLCFGQMFGNIVAGFAAFIDPDNVGWRLNVWLCCYSGFYSIYWILIFTRISKMVLKKIYGTRNDWVDFELAEIAVVHEQEQASRENNGSQNEYTIVTVMKTPHVRKTLWIGCSLCIFQQLSGIDTIMYYTAPLIKSAGIKDDHTTIWLSLGTSFVNFFGTVLPFFVIERYGRRSVLLVSTALTVVALVLLGSSFLALNLDTDPALGPVEMEQLVKFNVEMDSEIESLDHCLTKSNCDFCVTDDRCGYCSLAKMNTGLCLPLNPHNSDESLTGHCSLAVRNVTDFKKHNFYWEESNCNTKLTLLPLCLIVVYLLCFALGLSTIPWVMNAEIYPLYARGVCVSISTCAIWSANAFISLTFLTLASTVSRFGTFYLYATITAFAFYIFYQYVPDTSGVSIDEVEVLFMNESQKEAYLANLHLQVNRRQSLAIHDDEPEYPDIHYKHLDNSF